MSFGHIQVFTATIASGADSAAMDLGGKSFSLYTVQIPTMSTSAEIAVQGSADGTTYYPCYQRPIATASTTNFGVVISSGIGSSGGLVNVPLYTRYVKFVASAAVAGGVIIKAFAHD